MKRWWSLLGIQICRFVNLRRVVMMRKLVEAMVVVVVAVVMIEVMLRLVEGAGVVPGEMTLAKGRPRRPQQRWRRGFQTDGSSRMTPVS